MQFNATVWNKSSMKLLLQVDRALSQSQGHLWAAHSYFWYLKEHRANVSVHDFYLEWSIFCIEVLKLSGSKYLLPSLVQFSSGYFYL